MIRTGDEVLVWSGSQGAKMKFGSMNTNASAKTGGRLDLDQQVNYSCVDWQKDEAEFKTPAGIKFVDIGAILDQKINIQGALH